jgi:hypothetical protein
MAWLSQLMAVHWWRRSFGRIHHRWLLRRRTRERGFRIVNGTRLFRRGRRRFFRRLIRHLFLRRILREKPGPHVSLSVVSCDPVHAGEHPQRTSECNGRASRSQSGASVRPDWSPTDRASVDPLIKGWTFGRPVDFGRLRRLACHLQSFHHPYERTHARQTATNLVNFRMWDNLRCASHGLLAARLKAFGTAELSADRAAGPLGRLP